jgi:hypothetical protein
MDWCGSEYLNYLELNGKISVDKNNFQKIL